VFLIPYKGKEKTTNPRTYSVNKGKSSLTSLVACFILGKVYCRTYWGGYDCSLIGTSPPDRFVGFC